RAATDYHHGIGMTDPRDVERRSDPGHDAATDKTGTIERQITAHGYRPLRRDDAVLGECSQEHQMPDLASVGQPRLALPVEMDGLRAFGERLFTQNWQIAVAIEAVSAMRIPRQHDVIAFAIRPNISADLLDDPCCLMTEHDRHRVAQGALDHLEIGVAEPCSSDANQHVGRSERSGL